jgi:hypothetical protein
MDCAIIAQGMARLERAHVTPLCLTIRADGSWGFYKTVALAGHPCPGNARRGHSHPTDIGAFRASDSRTQGHLPPLPSNRADAVAIGEEIGMAIWPGEYSVWIEERQPDGEIVAIDICRKVSRDRSAPALVALAMQGVNHKSSIDMLTKGGRP